MGRKNKNKDTSSDNKNPSQEKPSTSEAGPQQPRPQQDGGNEQRGQQGRGNEQRGQQGRGNEQRGQQGRGNEQRGEKGRGNEQRGQQQQPNSEKGACGGGQHRDSSQQQGGGQQGRGNEQRGQQGRGNDQRGQGRANEQRGQQQQPNSEKGAWGGGQHRDSSQQQGGQQGRGNEQRGQQQQQQQPSFEKGAWGGGQHRDSSQQQGGGQQQGRGNEQRGQQQQPRPEKGVWGGGQHRDSSQQQGRGNEQRGQQQQQQQPRSEKGIWGGGQHRDSSQQQGGGQQGRGNEQRGQQGRGNEQRGQQGRGNEQRGQQQQQPSFEKGAWGGGQHRDSSQQQWGQQGRGNEQRGQQQQQQQQPRSEKGVWGGGQHRDSSQQQGGQQGRGNEQRGQQQQPNSEKGQWGGGQHSGGRQQVPRSQPPTSQLGGSGSQGSFNKRMEQLSISDETPLPVKEKSCNGIVRGVLGKPGVVEVNYLKLDLKNMPSEAYHYDVTINPDKPKKFLRPVIEQLRLESFPNTFIGFDGMKSLYTLQRLQTPIDRKVEVPDTNNRKKEFHVQIKETDNCVVDLNSLRTYQNERVSDKPMRALQVLEVVLASNNHERGLRVGRSFFRRPSDAYNLDDGYEAWTGLFQAAILGEEPLLNVDIAHKSFPCESTVLNYLKNRNIDVNQNINQSRNGRDVITYLTGINIIYTPPTCFGSVPKKYKVLGIGDPASINKFRTEDGKEQTVANYYKSKGFKLNYENLNCLTVGSSVRQISLPMELCSIPSDQALNRKDKDRQVQNMIRYAATSTNKRKQKIMELLRFFEHNNNQTIQAFGLRIGSNFIKVPMRLLPQPFMEYFQGKTVTTFKGAWRMDSNFKFLMTSKPPNGHKWAILYEDNNRFFNYHDLEDFKSNVIKTSQSLSMNLQNTANIKAFNFRQLQGILKDLAKENYDLVFVVLSERGTQYSKIKQTAELEVGILTQCIKDKTLSRTKRDMSVFSNIMLKVNGKLNGTNHKIAQERDTKLLSPIKNVMYLGADVTHPSPDQRHIPSVVGVAASHDVNGACYNCQYRLQRSTVENIEDMESIMRHHLQVYHRYQKSYPSQIIYYRDGVSDGQFPIVEREEIRAIKNACKKIGCNAKLTCVIVVKRHHTRFFPLTQPQHDRDFNNVQAGTVVDQHITHPNEVQFFMVSHQSIQGTAKPTRYNVIMDESNFDVNLLQKLTYNLCHLFPRCNRAVSYPAPAYLAHLVAFRGRVYLEGTNNFGNLNREYEKRQIRPEFLVRNPMYFI